MDARPKLELVSTGGTWMTSDLLFGLGNGRGGRGLKVHHPNGQNK